MPLTILCPQGHKLTCPDEMAGKRGKCPECGTLFRVPDLAPGKMPPPLPGATPALVGSGGPASSGSMPVVVAGAGPRSSSPAVLESPSGSSSRPVSETPTTVTGGSGTGSGLGRASSSDIFLHDDHRDPPPAADQFVFLCPDGHHLRGSLAIVGQPRTCPACQKRFLVPEPDEHEEEPVNPLEPPTRSESRSGTSFDFLEEGSDGDAGGTFSARGTALARMFPMLWRLRGPGVAIELHLGEGRVLLPEGFAPDSAEHAHGWFTVREANGTTTLSLIAWESIDRVAVRGLRKLPDGVRFE